MLKGVSHVVNGPEAAEGWGGLLAGGQFPRGVGSCCAVGEAVELVGGVCGKLEFVFERQDIGQGG